MSGSNTAHQIWPTLACARPKPLPAKPTRGTYQLTRGGAVCFAAIGVIAVASLNTGNNLLFMILAVVGAGVVISAAASRVILSGIRVDLTFPQRVFAQDRARVPITIHNARKHVPAYAISVRLPERGTESRGRAQMKMCAVFAPYVPPRGALHFEADFTIMRRGLYPSISLEISSHFPFGVLRRKQSVRLEKSILVFPALRPATVARRSATALGAGIENGQRGEGGDLYAIRAYHDGDPARHIDWKATAKTGAIKVREFTREAAESVALFLDRQMSCPMDDGARARFERAVSFCASLACEALTNHSSLQFATAGVRTRADRGQPTADAVLAALALIEPDASAETPGAASFNTLFAGITPLVVTDRPGAPMFSAAAAAGRVVAMSNLCEPEIPPMQEFISLHSL